MLVKCLVSIGHSLYLLTKRSPVICLKFGILDSLLTPILVKSTDVVLAVLEENKLVTNALFDEDAPRMLLNNRFLILLQTTNMISLVMTNQFCAGHLLPYLEDRLLYFLDLARFYRSLRTTPQILQLLLVGFNTLF